MNDWNIQSRAHACQACAKHFVDKEPYHTLLLDKKQIYERLDICDACWQNQYGPGANDRKGFVSFWRGIYQAPPPPAPEPIQRESAETLLRKIVELNDPKYASASFILAVMLERKRIFKVQQQFVREGQRVFVYEHAKNGDLFTIPDPNLQLNQLEEVQHQVAQLLEHGLEGPPAEPATEPTQPAASAEIPTESAPAGEAEEATPSSEGQPTDTNLEPTA